MTMNLACGCTSTQWNTCLDDCVHLRGCTFTHLAPSIRHLRVHTRAQPMDAPPIERLRITSHSALKTESDQTSVEGAHNSRSYGQTMAQFTENRTRTDFRSGLGVGGTTAGSNFYGQAMAQLTENRIRSVSLARGGGGGGHTTANPMDR